MKFATRLYLGFGLVISVMTLFVVIIVNMTNVQSIEINGVITNRYEKIKLINHVRQNVAEIDRDINSFLFDVTKQRDMTTVRDITDHLDEVNEDLEVLEQNVPDDQLDQLSKLKDDFAIYDTTCNQIFALINTGQSVKAKLLLTELDRRQKFITNTTEHLISMQEEIMDDTIKDTKEKYDFIMLMALVSILLGIALSIIVSLIITRRITVQLTRVKEVMKRIQYGSGEYPRIPNITGDVIGEIAVAYNQMATTLEEHEKHERIYMEQMEEQNWLKSKIQELSMLSQSLLELGNLGQRYIEAIVPMIGAQYGIIYIKTEKDDEEIHYTRLASYAYTNSPQLQGGRTNFRLGEGLIGQCALDNQLKELKDLPKSYLKISAGASELVPNHIIIAPVHLDGDVMAVIELASIHSFNSSHKSLIEEATAQLGIILNRIQKQMQVRGLLEEAQALNEELQSQSEELQMQHEELMSLNEELEAQNIQSEQKSNDLEKTKLILEEKTRQVLLNSQYKSEFLANMSHELRTPLNSLLILAQMLLENREGNLTEKQMEYVSTIRAAGNDLLGLITDILDLSKIESGKVDLQISKMDIREVLLFAEKQFTPIAEQKQIQFLIEIPDEIPNIIYTDEQKVYQIIKNLLSNAFKFTEFGKVHVQLKRLEVFSKHNEKLQPMIVLNVIDTGIGIAKGKEEVIFEAFSQADGTTSRKYGGTGLGLSISKELAALLRGYITVNSIEGQGSTFTLYLPIDLGTEHHLEEAAFALEAPEHELLVENPPGYLENQEHEDHGVLYDKKVLVVDDDMRNVFALTTALEGAGMKVIFAENGQEAIDLINEQSDIDIILMDIMMPIMDGYEAIGHIRKIPDCESIPIIALTAKAMKSDRQKCIELGASDYISKPVNLEQLLSLLKVWLYK